MKQPIREEKTPNFLILDHMDWVDCFTPFGMRWADSLWIMDLRTMKRYWQTKARSQQQSLEALFRTMLDTFEVKRAIFSDHPWQGVVALYFLRQRRMTGLTNLCAGFGSHFYRQITWGPWFHFAKALGGHLEAIKQPKFNRTTFEQQCRKMVETVQRLNLKGPWDLQEATHGMIQRRYGTTLASMWRWIFEGVEEVLHPWIPWAPPEPPEVSRILEFPLWQWEQVQPILVQDFDRLCAGSQWYSGTRVSKMVWSITFDDYTQLEIPLQFRNPHSLNEELGDHKTATMQAKFGLERALQRKEQTPNFDMVADIPLLSWRIRVVERIVIPDQILNFFGTSETHQAWPERLLQLENQLPIPLYEYEVTHDWNVTDSFHSIAPGEEPENSPEFDLPWLFAAQRRPLFLVKEPYRLEENGEFQFLERNMVKWWQEEPSSSHLDYFCFTNRWKASYWVARDSQQNWFVHGVFG